MKCRDEISSNGARRANSAETTSEPSSDQPQEPSTNEVPAWAFVERPPIDVDAWQWDEDLLEAERVIKAYGPPRGRETAERHRQAAAGQPADHSIPRGAATKRTKRVRSPKFTFVSWALLSLGVMALVFGGVLLGWSFWSGQQQFWTLGLPFTLAGQAGLILGLVLQLDGLWQSNQDATVVLTDLDEQIDELRQATSLLTTSHSSHAQSFYFHLAEGASPHMLLSDLKGQLDLLAMRMAKDDSP